MTMLGCVAMMGSEVYKDYKIEVYGMELPGDLVVLDIKYFDLILGIDWLSRHYANVDCRRRIIQFEHP